MHESEVAQSCPTLSDPMDCSLPGSSIHGVFQTRVLEWGAIAFSDTGMVGRKTSGKREALVPDFGLMRIKLFEEFVLIKVVRKRKQQDPEGNGEC